MLLYLIPLLILLASLCGMAFIVIKKLPEIASMTFDIAPKSDQNPGAGENGNRIVKAVKNRINFEMLLQKILSKITVSTLKIGNRTNAWLAHLRQKAKKEKSNYWEKIQSKKDKNQIQK